MRDIRIATAQFEHLDGDKAANLARIRDLTRRAASEGAEVVCFHECAISGYTFLQSLDRDGLASLAEPVPKGPSVAALIEIAREFRVVVMAGLVEIDAEGRLFNSYAVVSPDGFIACHRKLHVFISPFLSPGPGYTVFDHDGVRFGILTCYDNNLPENARATTLLGAEVIIAPHVTGCLPSTMPGRGSVDRSLWDNRHRDPSRLRLEFQGPKARGWLMRWLPARAWENGVYYVFSNPIGVDGDTVKPGLSMILDPHGEILAECHALGDDLAIALLTAETFDAASGRRYLNARRPELYEAITRPHPKGHQPITKPGWSLAYDSSPPS
ncbi:nitrilase family protein [Tautonia marina]|uniref:nitrilase family protein n=1 Tax=Tautonia marina TaxID=2653855 RepID=UPI0012604E88|nr:nitrilase family protein [Tautonia marina]